MENQSRGQWGSTFGFLMAAVGSAVGLGNIWGFPYKMGSNGGFAFLLVYIIMVIFVGIIVMLGELALGRKTGRGAVGAYVALSKKYKWVGMMGVASGFLILSFYSVLGGMVLRYAVGYLVSMFGADGFAGAGTGFFGFLLYDYKGMLLCYVIFMLINIVIVMGGIKGGIEKFSSIAMPALFFMLLAVIIYVACQPGAGEGYAFMFKPDFTALKEDFLGVVRTAAGQMFFSLSLGMGCMITYGSYLAKNENLQRNAVIIPVADSIIAILAGCAVMPACAAFGVDFGAGPGLLFASMQTVFSNMGGFAGNLMGFLFYFLVLLAAITSSISLLEVCTTYAIDKRIDAGKDPARKKITVIYAAIIFVVGLPVALDALGSGGAAIPAPYELLGLSGDAIKGWNDCWLDVYDLISEGILMPLGALVMSLIIGWKLSPTRKHRDRENLIVLECQEGGHTFKAYKFFDICFKYIVPFGMLIVLYGQIVSFFG
ncbi:MAG: sodium-dependent transporter [Ruminococcaceae bacterium]|nr:sodium-dependent transporter [Oscillospiraceae bacterium]